MHARTKLQFKSNRPLVALSALAVLFEALLMAWAPRILAHSGTKEEQDACTPDVFRLCSAVIPDEARIVACLNRKVAKLSPACRAVIDPPSKSSRARN
jgi:hypothetical protein